MPAFAKKVTKVVKTVKPRKQEQNDDEAKKLKKPSLKKIQKTAEIVAAKKLAKLSSKKAVSDKVKIIDTCFYFRSPSIFGKFSQIHLYECV